MAVEAGGDSSTVAGAVRICERLRIPLAKLAGVTGFATLLGRALALAKAKAPALAALRIREDGSIEHPDQKLSIRGNPGPPGDAAPSPDADAAVALVAQLLGLLITFIGEPLTLRLVKDVWPDLSTGAKNSQEKGAP